MMTFEEIVKKVEARFQDGRGRAGEFKPFGVPEFQCRYRGDNGVPCAVGCFISDDAYSIDMEDVSMHQVEVSNGKWVADNPCDHEALAEALTESGIPATQEVLDYLRSAQERHDDSENWAGTEFVGLLPPMPE